VLPLSKPLFLASLIRRLISCTSAWGVVVVVVVANCDWGWPGWIEVGFVVDRIIRSGILLRCCIRSDSETDRGAGAHPPPSRRADAAGLMQTTDQHPARLAPSNRPCRPTGELESRF